MTVIVLKTEDQVLSVVKNPVVASGDRNSVVLRVEFDSQWNDFTESAVFFTDNDITIYEVPFAVNNECLIPHEVLAEADNLNIGVRGVLGNLVKTSNLVKYKIVEGAPAGTGTTYEPTPDVYQQILTTMGETRQNAESAVETAVRAEEKAENAEAIAQNARDFVHTIGGAFYVSVTDNGNGTYSLNKTGEAIKEAYNAKVPMFVVTDYRRAPVVLSLSHVDCTYEVSTDVDLLEFTAQVPTGIHYLINGKAYTERAWLSVLIKFSTSAATVASVTEDVITIPEWEATSEETEGYILPQTTVESVDQIANPGFILEVGKTYTVEWNGTDYECECKEKDYILGRTEKYLGNPAHSTVAGADTGEPFFLHQICDADGSQFYADNRIIVHMGNDSTATVAIRGEMVVYNKMPKEFLPEEMDCVILASSTPGSKKKLRLTVDDNGNVKGVEVT